MIDSQTIRCKFNIVFASKVTFNVMTTIKTTGGAHYVRSYGNKTIEPRHYVNM